MRLVALKDLSDQLPAGTIFDWRDDHAAVLIALGVVRAADPTVREKRVYRRRDMVAET